MGDGTYAHNPKYIAKPLRRGGGKVLYCSPKIQPYKEFLKEINAEEPLLAILKVATIPEIKDNEYSIILFMAAAVELIENP